MPGVVGSVASIHRYPVKSMAGERLDVAHVGPGGVIGDRVMALRDVETGQIASAKRPGRWGALLDCRASNEGGTVVVTLPGGNRLSLEPGDRSLSQHLGREVVAERFERPGQGEYSAEWPDVEGYVWAGRDDTSYPLNIGGDHSTGFVDLAPIHLTTTSALRTLRDADPSLRVDIRRFRPTFVVDTGDVEGFPELEWVGRTLAIGSARFSVTMPTLRCVMVTAAQGDLPRQVGVLRTLLEINGEDAHMHDGERGRVANFGAYTDVAGPGTIAVGDEVHLV